jgi:hypothetical protein
LIGCKGSDVCGMVGVVAACDILKWTTGVGAIGPRWVDTGENICQILVRGTTETEKDWRWH